MHGLVIRSLQRFLRDTYGEALWEQVAQASDAPRDGFEAFEIYDDAVTDAIVSTAARALGKPEESLLEDFGIYLSRVEVLRRLLRFSGADYVDFLLGLDELPDRMRLALPEIQLPEMSLDPLGPGLYRMRCRCAAGRSAPVLAGILRAMADDYGALALIDCSAPQGGEETVMIELLDNAYSVGRSFELTRAEC